MNCPFVSESKQQFVARDTTASSLHESLMNCPFVSESKQQFVARDTTASSLNESLMNCPFVSESKQQFVARDTTASSLQRKSHELSLCVGIKATVRCPETQLLRV